MFGGLAEQVLDSLANQGVEVTIAALLLAHEARVLELPQMGEDLGLAHREAVLEIADAESPNLPR